MKSKQLEIIKALIIVGLYWNSHKRNNFFRQTIIWAMHMKGLAVA